MPAFRKIALLAAFVATGFSLGILADSRRPAEAARLTPVTLQLKWLHQAQFAGYYAALQNGYYRQEGLDVRIQPGGPDIVPEATVASGRAQFGVNWLSSLLVTRERGVPIMNVAQIFQSSGMRLVSMRDSGIDTVQEFRGKRVGVWPSGNEYQFKALMSEFGFRPPSRYMKVVSQPFEMTPFLEGDLDVAHAMNYNELDTVYDEVGRSNVNVFDYNQLGVSILEDGLFAEADWASRHHLETVRFLRASIKGWRWAVNHPEAAGRLSFKFSGESSLGGVDHQIFMARAVARLVNTGLARTRGIGVLDHRRYDRTWRTLLAQHVISRTPTHAYTQQYWQEATRRR